MAHSHAAPSFRPLIVVAGVLGTAAVLVWARTIVIPLALAVLLSFVLSPVVLLLQRRGLRRSQAAIVVLLFVLVVAASLFLSLSMQVHEMARELPSHKETLTRKVRDLFGGGPGVFGKAMGVLEELNQEVQQPAAAVTSANSPMPVTVVPAKTSSLAAVPVLAGPVARLIGSISLIVALTVTMLLFREELRNRLIRLVGEGHVTSTTRALDDATQRVSRYLLLQVMLNSGFGLVFGLGLAVIGVPYALLWGVLAAVLRFVPYIGVWMAAIFPLLISLTSEGWQQPVLTAGWAVLMGVVTNNLLEPLLVSRSTGLSPLALISAAAFWTWLWGPVGLVLSTPVTVCLVVIGRHVPALEFLDVLLGSTPALHPEVGYYQRLLARDVGEAAELVEDYVQTNGLEKLADEVLLPTLVRAQVDHQREALTLEELDYIKETTRDLMDSTASEQPPIEETSVPVLGCASHDGRERLALELLALTLNAPRPRMIIMGSKTTASEVLQCVEKDQPVAVCLACLAPRSPALVRYLCKRLRQRFAVLPIVAAVWGGDLDDLQAAQLRAAGATHVVATLGEARSVLAGLVRNASVQELQPA